MAQFRPAGLSDDDSDSDDYGFYEKPVRKYFQPQLNEKKKIENNLQEAIINGNVQEVEEIVAAELNDQVNTKLDSGWTPLMHACFHAQDKIVKLLLDKGADPNFHSDSVTPVMTACSNSSANNATIYNIVMDLIDKGCILNIGDKYGQTPLMRAISSGRAAVVEKLIYLKVNIEMRDQQGWTAVFWAAHHNQPEILEILIAQGARLNEVDRHNRRPIDIAESHEYTNIVEIFKKHLNIEEDEQSDSTYNLEMTSWQEYYPGMATGERPNYCNEIPHLLYGMNCERLTPLIMKSGMDLRSFLLLEEGDMIKMGIEMPFERQRLISGLKNFHLRGWKLNAVSGLYAAKSENYSVLECLTTLGTHLQQIYILEATLQYSLREYNRIQNKIKFEPPDSPTLLKVKSVAKKLLNNINNIRRESKIMKRRLNKIVRRNPEPADLIREKTVHEIAKEYVTQALVVMSLGLLAYHAKNIFINFLKK
ncbi:ankyrin repeat, SAM and basic leucine zipper domain-containing protein 1 [Anticarsia gemmatalis]|uniref:ankyrin repeat, SAM and basic leucine zipper domain-containing protein 1 n=1 Tax=Anticarsia gemmatalis TaxID=129554 RepID=UPI003F761E53